MSIKLPDNMPNGKTITVGIRSIKCCISQSCGRWYECLPLDTDECCTWHLSSAEAWLNGEHPKLYSLKHLLKV